MIRQLWALPLFILSAILFSVSKTGHSLTKEPSSERPYRAGIIRLSPELDLQKPLGVADFSGITEASGLLISAVEGGWVGGFRQPGMSPVWWIKTPSDLTIPPIVFGSWGILGFRSGELIKFNAQNGKTEWSLQLETFAARRVIKNSQMLIVVTASQSVYAIDYQSGKVLWVHDGEAPDGIAINNQAPPTVHGGVLYLGLASGEISAIDLENGKKIWTHNPAFGESRFHDCTGELYVLDKSLLVTRYDGIVTAVNLENHLKPAPGWENPKKFSTITANAFRHGRLYIGTHNGYVYALNPRNGQQIWETHTGSSVVSITAGETALFVAGSQGRISSLGIQKGEVAWHDQLEGQIASSPVYVGKDLFFSTGLKVLYGYKIR